MELSTSVSPLLDEIGKDLRRPDEEVVKWKKVLLENNIETLGSVFSTTSRVWLEELGLPLRLLNELRKKEKSNTDAFSLLERKVEYTQSYSHSSTSGELLKPNISEQSFRDLSQFIKPVEDKKRASAPGTLRRILFRGVTHSKHRVVINTFGREGHQSLLIRSYLESKAFDKDSRAYLAEVEVYSQEVELEIHDCLISQAEGSDCIIIVFSNNSYQSLTRMMDKWLETIKRNAFALPIILVGVNSPSFGASKSVIPIEKIREIADVMKVLRYFEVSNKDDAEEVFLEAARISIRELHSNIKIESIEKLQNACEKKLPHIDLRKRNITLLPSIIYFLSSFLQTIRLDQNCFKHFPMELVAFESLKELYLSNNQIEFIPNEIIKMTSLEKLDLENNLIDDIPMIQIKSLKKLVELKLKGNPLSKIPDEIARHKEGNLIPFISSFSHNSEQKKNNVFGVPLSELIQYEASINQYAVLPRIVSSGLNHTIKHGIGLEGIFRVAGQNNKCSRLKDGWDLTGANFNDNEDPHDVANVLKQWLRDLPSPLFLYENFDKMLALNQLGEAEKLEQLKATMESLPKENYHLLRQLFRVMYNIAINSGINRMDDANITKVIGPNLLFSNTAISNDPYITLQMISNVNDILTTVTSNYPALFEDHFNLFESEFLDPRPNIPAVFYRKLCGHEKSVVGVCISDDMKTFTTADSKGILRFWSLDTLKLIDAIETNVKRLNFILKCENYYWISTSHNVQIFSISERKIVAEVDFIPYSIAVIGDNVLLDDRQSLALYNGVTFKPIARISINYSTLSMIYTNCKIWIACNDQKIRIYNAENLKLEEELELGLPRFFKLLSVGNEVWCFGDNKIILVIDPSTTQILSKFEGSQKGKVFGIFLVDDTVWLSDRNGEICAYSKDYKQLGSIYPYHNDAIGGITHFYDQNMNVTKVISVSWDKSIIIWIKRKL